MNSGLLILRPEPKRIDVVNIEDQRVPLTEDQVEGLEELLPYPQELQKDVPLPDSVLISALARSGTAIASRRKRVKLLSSLADLGVAEEAKNEAINLFNMASQ